MSNLLLTNVLSDSPDWRGCAVSTRGAKCSGDPRGGKYLNVYGPSVYEVGRARAGTGMPVAYIGGRSSETSKEEQLQHQPRTLLQPRRRVARSMMRQPLASHPRGF